MDADEIIETGGDYEDNASEGEFDGEEVQDEEAAPEVKPELKRLYQQHPECNLDYIEQVIPKILYRLFQYQNTSQMYAILLD